MKKYKINNKKRIIIFLTIIFIFLILFFNQSVFATSIPKLKVYNENGNPKLEWATEMLDSNVLVKTSFEIGELRPNLIGPGTEYNKLHAYVKASAVSFSGEYGYSLLDNSNGKGNHFLFPETSSSKHILQFGKFYFPNGTPISMTFKAKIVDGTVATISPKADGGWANSIETLTPKLAKKALKGDKVLYLDSLTGLAVGDILTTDTDKNTITQLLQIKEIKTSNKSITLNLSINKDINVGQNLKHRPFRAGFYFPVKKITNTSWETYNINTVAKDYADFDIAKRGASFYTMNTSTNRLIIDDVKFGYATEVQVFRKGTSIYKGYLSEFNDTSIKDNIKPDKVTTLKGVLNKKTSNVAFTITKPNDTGVTTSYTIRSIAKNGTLSAMSPETTITVGGEIKGYNYIISNNTSTTNLTKNTTAGTINLPLKDLNVAEDYILIQSIDVAGNKSSIQSFKLSDIVNMRLPAETKAISNQILENKTVSKTIDLANHFSEPDGQNLTYTVKSNNSNVIPTVNGSTLTLKGNDVGVSTITVTVNNGFSSINKTFTTTVNNRLPIETTVIPNQVLENKTVSKTIDLANHFSEPDEQNLTYTVKSNNSNVIPTVNGSTLTLNGSSVGSSTITVVVSDGIGSITKTFTTTVNNRLPVEILAIQNQTLDNKNMIQFITLTNHFSEPDEQNLTYTISSNNTNVRPLVNGSILTLEGNHVGSSTITIVVSDGIGSITKTFNVTVNNRLPVEILAIPNQILENKTVSKTVNLANHFIEPDGQSLTYTVNSNNTNVIASVSGSTLTLKGNNIGSSTITVTISDGIDSIKKKFNVTVNNRLPVEINKIKDSDLYLKTKNNYYLVFPNYFNELDGQNLTYTVTSDNDNVLFDLRKDDLNMYSNKIGKTTFTVRVSDGIDSIIKTFSVTVNNSLPIETNVIPVQTLENKTTSKTINLNNYFSEPDEQNLTYTVTSNNSNVIATVNGSNLTLKGNNVGSSTIMLTVSDGIDSIKKAFTTIVNNRLPIETTAIPNQTLENKTVSKAINLSNYFSELDGQNLNYTVTSNNSNVLTVVNGSTLTLKGNNIGSSTITLTISDGIGSITKTFTTTVNNRLPIEVSPIQNQTLENKTISKTVNLSNHFSELDGQNLTYTVSSNNTNVIATVNGSTLTLKGNHVGSSIVTVVVSDGIGSITKIFNTTVNNRLPVETTVISNQTLENKTVSKTINLSNHFSEPDGQNLTYTVKTNNDNVIATVNGSTLTLKGNNVGSSTVTITISDGIASITKTFTTTVNNRLPIETIAIPNQTLENKTVSKTVDLANHFSEPDGQNLTYTVTSNNDNISTNVSGSILTLKGNNIGSSIITVTINDGIDSITKSFTTNVNNRLPIETTVISNQVLENKTISKTINLSNHFSEPDGQNLTYIVTSNNSNVIATVNGSTLTLKGNHVGESAITVVVSDGIGSITKTFTTTVNNRLPIETTVIPNQILENKTISKTINLSNYFNEPDGQNLTYTVTSNNNNVIVNVDGSVLILKANNIGSSTITVNVSDGVDLITKTFDVTVHNRLPIEVLSIQNQVLENKTVRKTIDLSNHFNELDGQKLIYTVKTNNDNVITNVNGTDLVLKGNNVGSTIITITVSDGIDSITKTFTTNVGNRLPVEILAIQNQILENKTISKEIDLTNHFSELDGQTLTYTVSSNNSNVITTINDSTLTLKANHVGSSIVTLTISDGIDSITKSFNVTINNRLPIETNAIPNQVLENKTVSKEINLSNHFSESDGQNLTYTVTSNNTNVIATVSDSKLTLKGNGVGSSTITIIISDGIGSITKTFTTTVNNRLPIETITIPNQTLENKTVSKTVDLANHFNEPDGQNLTYTVTSNNNNVIVSVDGSILKLKGNHIGSSTITIVVSDGIDSITKTFNTTVNNRLPIETNAIPNQVLENKNISKEIILSNHFNELDGQNLTYTVSSNNNNVIATLSGSTLTLQGNNIGNSVITIVVSDGIGSITKTFTTTVKNRLPVETRVIPNQVLENKEVSKEINLSNHFSEPDGQNLIYTVKTNNDNVIVKVSDSTLILKGNGVGESTITVVVSDGLDSITKTFDTSVGNRLPIEILAIPNQVLENKTISKTINLNNYFNEPDGQTLIYTVSSNNNNVIATVSDSTLILEGNNIGNSVITVVVSDGLSSITKTFTTTVNNRLPIEKKIITARLFDKDNDFMSLNLNDYFVDPDGENLIYTINFDENKIKLDLNDSVLSFFNNKDSNINETTLKLTISDGLDFINKDIVIYFYKEDIGKDSDILHSDKKEKKALLKLSEGDFNLQTSNIKSFGKINLKPGKEIITTDFENEFGVIDARGTQQGYYLNVSATPFIEDTFDGFIGEPVQLPVGTLALNSVNKIQQIGLVHNSQKPTPQTLNSTIIDNGSVNVLQAGKGQGMGEFVFNFGDKPLSMVVDSTTAKIDNVNYPSGITPYTSTITWDLITGP